MLSEEAWRIDRELEAKLRMLHPDASWGGWITPRDRVVVEQVLLGYPRANPVVLEVGVFMGGCSNVILTTREDAVLLALDNWSEGPHPGFETLRDGFLFHTEQYQDRIEIYDGDSIEIGRKWNRVLDVVLIDGNHSYRYASSDIENFAFWVRQNGYVILDDYDNVEVKRAIDERLWNSDYEVVRLPDLSLRGADHEKLIIFKKRVETV